MNLPWNENRNMDDAPSIAQMAVSADEVNAAHDARNMDVARALVVGSKRKTNYEPFDALAKSRVQLALLELIAAFETMSGPAKKRKGRDMPKGLFMQQKALADQLYTDQSTVSKSLKNLANRNLIYQVDGVWLLNWSEVVAQAMDRGWVPVEK